MTRPHYRWTLTPEGDHCPSCLVAAGQVHTYTDWLSNLVLPKSNVLLCSSACTCQLIATNDPVQGDIQAIIRARFPEAQQTMDHQHILEANAQHTRLQANGQVTASGEFQIHAITEGVGNGWTFTGEVLKNSLPLWEGLSSFIDHASFWEGHSLRDLAGIAREPKWDADARAVTLTLKPIGPSGPLLAALGKEMLAEGTKPKVGFSADVIFTAKDKVVESILRVLSLDLVFDPARGGAFIRALNSVGANHMAPLLAAPSAGREAMAEHSNTQAPANGAPATPAGSLAAQLTADSIAVQQLLGEQERQAALAAEAEKARAVRVQMCSYLLNSGLAASRLPAAAQSHIRKQFEGKVFEPAELTAAIDDQRALVAALTAGAIVQGPGRVSAMLSNNDTLQAAVDDLLGAPRDEHMKNAKVHRLSGIRELYHALTGDFDFHGGYYPDRVQFATTADFTGLVKNALNKIVVDKWSQMGRAGYDWWRPIVTVEHFSTLNQITGTLVGSVGTLPTVAEGAEYTELIVGDSPEVASFTKYGGYIPLTLELLDRDDARKLAAYPRELANAAIRRLSGLLAAIFTDNSGVGPTLADGGALFNSTAVTTAGGHKNLLTTALAGPEWEVVGTAMYNQPMLIKNAAGYYGTGAKQAINPRFLLVPRALRLAAKQILYPALERAATIYTNNLQRGEDGDVITVPEWTDATDWAAVADPAIAPAIYVGERFGLMPEIFVAGDQLSPAVFMNDETRIKVRFFTAVWVNDFRPLHKSNV